MMVRIIDRAMCGLQPFEYQLRFVLPDGSEQTTFPAERPFLLHIYRLSGGPE